MSKTKKLTAGVPIVDSSGAVTPVSIAELAVLVGERLGVQGATYVVEQTGWIRIAKIGSSSGIINFTHTYNTTPTKAAVIAVCGAYDFNRVSAKIITGNPSVFNKLRFISKGKECYLEVYSVLSSQNQWSFKTFTVDCQSTSEPFELYKTLTPGYAPETGYAIKEFTLDDLQMGGGINAAPSSCYEVMRGLMTEKGELQHERQDKEGIGITDSHRGDNAAGILVGWKCKKDKQRKVLSFYGFQPGETGSERFGYNRILWHTFGSLFEFPWYRSCAFNGLLTARICPSSPKLRHTIRHIRSMGKWNLYTQKDSRDLECVGSVGYTNTDLALGKEVVAA